MELRNGLGTVASTCSTLFRRLRWVRNRLDSLLVEHLDEHVGHDIFQIVSRRADHLRMQAKCRIETVLGHVRLRRTRRAPVVQQRGNRAVRIQYVARTATPRTLPRPPHAPQPGSTGAGGLDHPHVPNPFQLIHGAGQSLGNRQAHETSERFEP